MAASAETVLVTGATGVVGRQAVTALRKLEFDVIAVARRNAPVSVDLLDAAARRAIIEAARPRYLLHLAWETRHGHFWSAAENDDWLAASIDLVRLFIDAGGRRIVVAGTCAEYDWSKLGHRAVAEDAAIRPATRYGSRKNEMHMHLAAAARTQGLSHAWGRVFLVTGSGEHPERLVSSLARSLIAGEAAACTSGSQVRDFMDSRDAGAAFAALLASDVEGPVNVASGEPHSIRDVALTLGRLSRRPQLLRFGALPDRPDDPPHLVADIARLRREVGFRPEIGFEAMLADALARWRNPTAPL